MNAINPEELNEQQLQDLLAKKQQQKAADRDAYKNIIATTVPQAVDLLRKASDDLTGIKTHIFNLFRDVLILKSSVYDIKDQQQSHTFTDSKCSITIGYRVLDAWDDTCHTGIQKVNAFLETLAKDENSAKLVEIVFRLLRKDAKGNLRANRVIELQKMAEKFNDAGFKDGVEIIMKSYQPKRSCWFIEAFYINDAGEKVGVPLSISAVDFADDFEFDFAPKAAA